MHDADVVWDHPDEELLLKLSLPLIQESLKKKVNNHRSSIWMNLAIP